MSSEDRQATDITLDGHDPVLPGAAKITLIIPKRSLEGVLKESLFQTENWFVHPARLNDAAIASICPLGQVGPSGPTNSCNPLLYGYDPDDIGNKGYDFAFQDFPPSYWAI